MKKKSRKRGGKKEREKEPMNKTICEAVKNNIFVIQLVEQIGKSPQ